jgi:hypothetical protein
MEKKVDCYKYGVEGILSTHNSIKEACKHYFKGNNTYQKMIQKSCSGAKKKPLEAEVGMIYFRYRN